MEILLLTGRTHQIRVHAAHVGHPLAGDERYGDPEFNERMRRSGLERMFLHAHSVAFAWPDSGEELSVSVPLPPELGAVLDALSAG
jgi:23S rRNA pseudouridine955/2504/2580 synthase